MLDLTDFYSRVNIGAALLLIVLLLTFIFFAKFPTKKSSRKHK